MSFFLTFASVGVGTVVIREVSQRQERANEIVGVALRLRLVMSVIAYFLCFALLPAIGASRELAFLVLLASGSLVFALFPLYLVLYAAQLRMWIPTLVFAGCSVVVTAIKLGMILLRLPVEAFAASETAVYMSYFVVGRSLGLRSGLRPSPRFDRELIRSLLRQALPVGITLVLIQVYLRVDQVMLYSLVGPEEVAIYAVGVRLVELANVVPIVFMRSAYPIISRLSAESDAGLERATRLSFRAMAWAAMPATAFLFAYPEDVLRFLFGAEFAPGGDALRILSGSIIFAFANSVLYNQLFATKGQMTAAGLAGFAALLNVGLNVPLINAVGAEGAAIATLISYAVVSLAAIVIARSRELGKTAWLSNARPAIAGAIALGAVLLSGLGPISGAVLLVGAYVGLLFAIGEVRKPELRVVWAALGRGGGVEDVEPQPPTPSSA